MEKVEKVENPKCYVANNNTYPLCVGLVETLDACRNCSLFENMIEEHDQD